MVTGGGSPWLTLNSGSPLQTPSASSSVPESAVMARRLRWGGLRVKWVRVWGEDPGLGGAGACHSVPIASASFLCRASVASSKADLAPHTAGISSSRVLLPVEACRCQNLGGDRVGAVPRRRFISRWLTPTSDPERQARPLISQAEGGGRGAETHDSRTRRPGSPVQSHPGCQEAGHLATACPPSGRGPRRFAPSRRLLRKPAPGSDKLV